ncbi:MAG: hypothetical protein OFPII_25480 [Osedax symbiont Rs1]|nr:MAG: hypothetical protein OFPII_25480 [Osedax symbiont Rs1]
MINNTLVATFMYKTTTVKVLQLAFTSALLLVFLLLWLKSEQLIALFIPKIESIEVSCPLQQRSCVIETKQGPIQLSISSPIESLTPFNIKLDGGSSPITRAKIRFEGFNDYMGINQFSFKQTSAANNLWNSRGSIPICTSMTKTWKVIISLYQGDQYSSYWFKIQTL